MNVDQCGWLYDTYGAKLICPAGLYGAGFCGVNNKDDCNEGRNFIGLMCCPPA